MLTGVCVRGGCVYVFVSMRTHVCVHVWRAEVDIWCLS